MADFKIAEKIIGANEGGYAFDKDDTGGETYAGVSRVHWPKWEGWHHIDDIKKLIGKTAKIINYQAGKDSVIKALVSKFYKQNFWDQLSLDKVENQQIANTVMDFAVNAGTMRAAKLLQSVVGQTQDGLIGKNTLKSVNSSDPECVYIKYNERRRSYYTSIAKGSQAKFLKSWLSRLNPYVA